MNIIEAIHDENLFGPFLGEDLSSWYPWLAALRALYGLPINGAEGQRIIREVTGREPDTLPSKGFSTALFLTGRRSGKSRVSSLCAAQESVMAGHHKKLAKGERGVVAVCAPTKAQGRIVKDYLRAIFDPPVLAAEVVRETPDGFELRNNVRIEIMAGDFRSIRGYTLLAAIVDEVAFFGIEDEAKIKSDTELIRAIQPALATVGGKLIAISSPYARKGWTWKTYQRHYGNPTGRTLVLNCPSRTLNPTLPQEVVDEAIAEDLQAAKSEYLGEFRDDVATFLPREIIDALVVENRTEIPPRKGTKYYGFVDLSGGRADDAALCIAHREERTVVVDLLCRYRPPFNPYEVCRMMAGELRRYGLRRVVGDNYSADFVAMAFSAAGIIYHKAEKPKAQLYTELLPRMTSREIELPDDDVLIAQLAALERRTRSGGRDIIDHPSGGHDDLANAVAGAAAIAAKPMLSVGAL